jgi:hypothetical protein
MRFRLLGLSLAGFAAAASAHDGLKIVTRETFPAGSHETTTYAAGDRVRVERRTSSRLAGGETQQHEYIQLGRCDLNRTYVLNPADRTYQGAPLQTRITRLERFALSLHRAANEPQGDGDLVRDDDLVVETTTVDTGERKVAFGYSARRVVSTRRQFPRGQAGSPAETVTDGWYIDLETRPICEREEAGRPRAVLIAVVSSPTGTRRSPPRVTFKDIGDPEEGFPLETTQRWRGADAEASEMVVHQVVTHLSRQRFEASLFEIPEGYRCRDPMFATVAARWGRTTQIIRSVVASWFGRAR